MDDCFAIFEGQKGIKKPLSHPRWPVAPFQRTQRKSLPRLKPMSEAFKLLRTIVSRPFPSHNPSEFPLSFRHLDETRKRFGVYRSEEHTSELQSRENLVCRL